MTIYYAKRTRIVTYRKNFLVALIALLGTVAGVSLLLAFPATAHAATTPAPSFETCKNLVGWYVNDDETAERPAATIDGLLFTGKNLIHHATDPIDLADMDKVTTGYSSTNSGKVVFKVETNAPYSTIVTDADGKLWSTAMSADQTGGQSHPVDKYSAFVGLDTKPGKAHFTADSKVTTFGVGYWTEDGQTTVTAIDFHGKTYPLTCPPAPTATPSATPSKTPSSSSSSASNPHHVSTTPNPPANGPQSGSGALAITGPSGWVIGAVAVGLAAFGGILLIAARRRRINFKA